MTTTEAIAFTAELLRDQAFETFKGPTGTGDKSLVLRQLIRAQKDLGLLLKPSLLSEIVKVVSGVSLSSGQVRISDLSGILTRNYMATADSYIKASAATTNFQDKATLLNSYSAQDESDAIYPLIKPDFSTIAAGSVVSSAVLNLYATTAFLSATFAAYRLKRAWTQAGATYNKYDGTSDWQSVGADGANDIDSTDVVSSGGGGAITINSWKQITLNPALVQAMIGASATYGNGLKISRGAPTGFDVREPAFSSSRGTYRPYFTLTFRNAATNILGSERGILKVKTGTGYWCKPLEDDRLLNNKYTTPPAKDPAFKVEDNSVKVYPITETTCDVVYKEVPPDMVDGGQAPSLNVGLHELMCKLAEAYCRRTLPEQPELGVAAYQEAMERIAALNKI